MTTQANVHDISFGTGYELFLSTILPAVEAAQHDLILVTCFWADSPTRLALSDSLLRLSHLALQRKQQVTVRIGFSSSGLLQKLLHTPAPEGRTYAPSEWPKLGLPWQEDLPGLDVEVKSIFFRPFSVWHPKFVIVDGDRVLLPSCNVSWEIWFEGCVQLNGPIVQDFNHFWLDHWASPDHSDRHVAAQDSQGTHSLNDMPTFSSPAIHVSRISAKFLPSQHHCNPNFRLPWQQCAPPPSTPLNLYLLDMFARAQSCIYMQTPNVTSPPILDALMEALERGIDTKIVTSERLMILEQLFTAGTTTSRCMNQLVSQHRKLLSLPLDQEAGLLPVGRLQILYYEPRTESESDCTEPVQSHLKLTVTDNDTCVFGSGNMDRASWYTSQELGVAFQSSDLVAKFMPRLQKELEGRTKLVYDSAQA